jgi:hypothetical protein
MKQGRPAMLLAMLFVAHTVSAGSFLDTTGAIIFINIPLGGDVATRPPPSFGLDVDLPVSRIQRGPWRVAEPSSRSVAPLEIELPNRGRYRVKVGGFYLDSLK